MLAPLMQQLAVVGDPRLDAGQRAARPMPKRWFSIVEYVATVAVSVMP